VVVVRTVVGGLVGGTVVGGAVVGGAVVSGVGGAVEPGGSVGGGVVGLGAEVPPVEGRAVVAVGRRVVAVVPDGPSEATVVSVPGAVVDVDDVLVEVDELVEVVGLDDVVVGRDDWLATCCFGDVSSPVATSSRSTIIETDART
jgi:microsomal dipeptidase-like Zn-dependent dipeptidase